GNSNNLLRNIINNGYYGMGIWNATNNIISENTVENNEIGIFLEFCHYNTISGNYIIENVGSSAYDDGTDNQWDNGVIGNFWSDYSGVDANDVT
ncbi:unnamed protein product, partial [marine sediment metagenome]